MSPIEFFLLVYIMRIDSLNYFLLIKISKYYTDIIRVRRPDFLLKMKKSKLPSQIFKEPCDTNEYIAIEDEPRKINIYIKVD